MCIHLEAKEQYQGSSLGTQAVSFEIGFTFVLSLMRLDSLANKLQ